MSLKALSAALNEDAYTMTVMADGTGVLLDLKNESLLTFNDTGTFMFTRVKDGLSGEAIVAQVVASYQVDEVIAQSDVATFIRQLQQALGITAHSE